MPEFKEDDFQTVFAKQLCRTCDIDWVLLDQYNSEELYSRFKTLWTQSPEKRAEMTIPEPLELEDSQITPKDYEKWRED